MDKKDIQKFKERLENEKKQLEAQLSSIGTKTTKDTNGWEANSDNITVDTADPNELADKLEEFEGNSGIVSSLEQQLTEVVSALERIENNTYGNCEICGKPIEIERLEANPSARNSIKHNH